MMAFARHGGAYVARLDRAERSVLLDLVDEVVTLLADGGPTVADRARSGAEHPVDALRIDTEERPTPADPALRRLLPDASADPEVSAEFRRLTEGDLRLVKTDRLLRLRATLASGSGALAVRPEEASQVSAALTDLRLVVSTRLGVRTDDDAEALYALVRTDADRAGEAEEAEEADDGASERTEPIRRFLATVYVALSLLQESLVELMLDELPSAPG